MKKKIIITVLLALVTLIACIYLVPEAYDHIYGYFLFRKIGLNLTANIKGDFNKAKAVALWAFDTIKPPEGDSRYSAIDDNFLRIYKRGYGFCDQSAHVYATMMHWLGFEAKLLMLRKEDGTSPHTVAVVKVNGRFMAVDTMYRFIFADGKGVPAAIDELEGSEIFKKYLEVINTTRGSLKMEPVEMKAAWFKNGNCFVTFPYAGKKYVIKKILIKLTGKGEI